VLAAVRSATVLGVTGLVVNVEVHVSSGLPGFSVVGLADTAVREARERVRAAFLSSQVPWPQKKVTVNLAPGWVRKSGPGLDLALAAALLLATDELPAGVLDGVGVLGELGLDGSIRSVPGTLAVVSALLDAGIETVIVPAASVREAQLAGSLRVLPARSLGELRACLKGEEPWPDTDAPAIGGRPSRSGTTVDDTDGEVVDLAEVRGQATARRALEACAAGGHHLLMVGPPGGGKTMLARRLPTILPPLPQPEALEVTRIHSAAGQTIDGLVTARPFRAPHHTASTGSLVGGGAGRPRPGEVTMAHRGVLFLDELGEFAPTTLDALRQPLEDRAVRIARSHISLVFPADFVLVACSNPCPCGMGPPRCRCDALRLARYRRRLSAPLLDRFDARVVVTPPPPSAVCGEPSAVVRERVIAAVDRQAARYRDLPWSRNAHVPAGALDEFVVLDGDAVSLLRDLAASRGLTARGVVRVRRLARTLADLDGSEAVECGHVVLAADLRAEVLGQ
jgi:magnesium chelatase family protein